MKCRENTLSPGYLELAAAGLFGLVVMAAVQNGSPHLPGNDGYYHLKMASLLPELGFVKTFPWLRWTIFSDHFVSHHYGFHLMLSPFAVLAQRLLGDAVPGGKLASAVAMAATFVVFLILLRRSGVRAPMVWLLFLCVAPWHFWLRMAYVRAPMAALPLLLLATHWTIRGRTIAVGVLAFLFTHVYGGGVLYPLVPAAFLLGSLLVGESPRLHIRQVVAATAGVGLGLILNPYFPANLLFLYTQLFETGLGAARDVGGEWKPYDAWVLFSQSLPLFVVWGWSLVRRLREEAPADVTQIGLLVLNAAFFVLTLKSRRFIEYWPPFALLSAAALYSTRGQTLSPTESASGRFHAIPRRVPSLGGATIAIAVVVAILNLQLTQTEIRPSHDVDAIRSAMAFLKESSPAGSLVFTDDWDVFPTCFYFNHHNTYAVGLDPEFTRTRYPDLWERYRRITRAELPAKLSPEFTAYAGRRDITYNDIASVFNARYVLVASDHPALYRVLTARPDEFTRVFPPTQGHLDPAQPPMAIFEVVASPASNKM